MRVEFLNLAEPVYLVLNEDNGTLCICHEDWGSVTWSIKNIPLPYLAFWPWYLCFSSSQYPVLHPELNLLLHLLLDSDPCALQTPPCPPVSETLEQRTG